MIASFIQVPFSAMTDLLNVRILAQTRQCGSRRAGLLLDQVEAAWPDWAAIAEGDSKMASYRADAF